MGNLKIGFSTVNVNPPLGIPMMGYYVERNAKGFLDDLHVKTLLVEANDKKIVIISVDVVSIQEDTYVKYVNAIEKETGISKDNIFLSATHTHTGPFIEPAMGFKGNETVEKYNAFLGQRIVDSVKLAIFDLKPSKMGYIVGYAPERVAYIRRYKMKDGTTMTCPPVDDPNIDHAIGELDNRVNVLRFDRENSDSIVLVNFGVHSDTIGGELISADFPYWMSKTIEKALDGTKSMFFGGAQGDVGSTNVHPKDGDMNDTEISFDNEMKSPGMARFVGRALAGTVLQVYDKVKYVDVDDINILIKNLKVPSNMPEKSEVPLAKEYIRLHEAGQDDKIPYEGMELSTVIAEAYRICRLENGPEHFDIRLTGVKIGPVALVGIAGQPFSEAGIQIKETEGFEMIMPCVLVNGSVGYFPMKSAYDEGGYEAKGSPFKEGVAERIVEGSRDLLAEL